MASALASSSRSRTASAPPRPSRKSSLSISIVRPCFHDSEYNTRMPFDTGNLVAIDTHVHIESEVEGNAADEAAKKYFGDTGVPRGRNELAAYYRTRKI